MKRYKYFLQKQNPLTILGLCFLCTFSQVNINAQQKAPSALQLADNSFKEGNYYTAAKLYDQFLNPPKRKIELSEFPLHSKRNNAITASDAISRLNVIYKQAEAYRLANYFNEAATLYKECIDKAPADFSGAWYWLAVCNRSLGNYVEAEEALSNYKETGDTKYNEEVNSESQRIRFIREQLGRKDSVLFHVRKISIQESSESGLFAPINAGGSQFLFTSTYTDSVKVNGTNPYHNRLYNAALIDGNLKKLELVNLETAQNVNQVGGSLSADGNTLYFTQWDNLTGAVSSSIHKSTRIGNGWSKPEPLNSINIPNSNNKHPFTSNDGHTLYFASDRVGGYGQFDIWYAPINNDGSVGNAVNAGPYINSIADDEAPFYHASSNTLVFASNRTGGMGGFDLYKADGNIVKGWQSAENIGYPLNSSRDDRYFFAAENKTLFAEVIFSSDRGSSCCMDSYILNKDPKQQFISGVVRNKRSKLPLAGVELTWKEEDGAVRKVTTDETGTYSFKLDGSPEKMMTAKRDAYKELTTLSTIIEKDEADLLINKITTADIFLEKKLVLKPENVVTVYFDFDKFNLKTDAIAKMDSIYNMLADDTTAIIQISGYTDGLGTVEYNKILSDRRAIACAKYLVEKGLDSNRISFESFGACCPVEMEIINGLDNAEGRSKNRRALINISRLKEEED